MSEIVTYSLQGRHHNSDKFYEEINYFTKEVILRIEENSKDLIQDYMKYVECSRVEEVRGILEYELEFLMLGVLWNAYISKAMALHPIPKNMLVKLSRMRKKAKIKKLVDTVRGGMSTLFLHRITSSKVSGTKENLLKLIAWLEATGEFQQEAKRLTIWSTYVCHQSLIETKKLVKAATNLAMWFETRSKEVLGGYTEKVDAFLEMEERSYRWREDYISCGRKRVEYHLNMVGAQMMNQAYRPSFLLTKEKRLLLPGCMRAHCSKDCKARFTAQGLVCTQCTKDCKVSQYTILGEEKGFTVYIVPHESSMGKSKQIGQQQIGIIGVACVLNLISGGLKAVELGFVPQCVLLDYCGCSAHWTKEGIVTDININRLLEVFGEDRHKR